MLTRTGTWPLRLRNFVLPVANPCYELASETMLVEMGSGFEHTRERVVGVTEATALTVSAFEHAELKATHIAWEDGSDALSTECEIAPGYVVYLLRHPLPSHPYWVDDREVDICDIYRGQFLLLDLRAQHAALVSGTVDCVSVFTGADALERSRAAARGARAASHGCEPFSRRPATPKLASDLGASAEQLGMSTTSAIW